MCPIILVFPPSLCLGKTWAGLLGAAELWPGDPAEETGPGRWGDQSDGPVALCGQIRRTGDFRDAALR